LLLDVPLLLVRLLLVLLDELFPDVVPLLPPVKPVSDVPLPEPLLALELFEPLALLPDEAPLLRVPPLGLACDWLLPVVLVLVLLMFEPVRAFVPELLWRIVPEVPPVEPFTPVLAPLVPPDNDAEPLVDCRPLSESVLAFRLPGVLGFNPLGAVCDGIPVPCSADGSVRLPVSGFC